MKITDRSVMQHALDSTPEHERRNASSLIRIELVRVLALGLNAWVVLVLLPPILRGGSANGSLVGSYTPLILLLCGGALLRNSPRLSAWVLLGAYPFALGAAVVWLSSRFAGRVYSAPEVLLGAATLIAHGIGSAHATTRPRSARESSQRPLGSVAPITADRRRVWLQRSLVALVGAGAFVLAVWLPLSLREEAFASSYGTAGKDARLLTAVIAGALGTLSLALFVGPNLRASRERAPSEKRVRRRVAALLSASLFGVFAYVVISRL